MEGPPIELGADNPFAGIERGVMGPHPDIRCRCFPITMNNEHYDADSRKCVCYKWDRGTHYAADNLSHHVGCWLSEGRPVLGLTPARAHALMFGDEDEDD